MAAADTFGEIAFPMRLGRTACLERAARLRAQPLASEDGSSGLAASLVERRPRKTLNEKAETKKRGNK